MNNIDQAAAALKCDLQNLQVDWHRTQSTWQDEQATRFEQEDFTPLAMQTTATIGKMAELGAVIAQARRRVH